MQGQLDEKIDEHRVLLGRISKVPRSPVCLALALVVCRFPSKLMHDAGIRECFQTLLRVPVTQHMWEMASLPFAFGRFVLEKRRALAVNRALGQLGRHSPCDPRTSS